MKSSVDDQLDHILLGAQFGDDNLARAMTDELRLRLTEAEREGRPLKVYAGYDPSKPDLHIGHSVTMRKLRLFQDYGHDVVFVIGTFTAEVGDTSDKLTGRPRLESDSVRAAAESYAEQAFKILDPANTTLAYNHTWLSELKMADIIALASRFTVQQFLERDNYRQRISTGNPVGLHEVMYPLLQGYDAVHLQADVQLGASEQLFNIMAGRKLQQVFGQRGCVCLTYPIVVGIDGVERMSKSKGNYIGLSEPPDEQFGKTMNISDSTMRQWMPLVTRWSPREVADRMDRLESGDLHPMDCKKQLAHEIVAMYHGDQAADEAQARFESVHQRRTVPTDLPECFVTRGTDIVEVLVGVAAAESKSAARRLIQGRGVRLDGVTVEDPTYKVVADKVLRVGKRHFYQLVVRD